MRLNGLRTRFEVAADTLHPRWRQLLSIIGEPTRPRFTGHPHDWVIADDEEPIPLRKTYQQWDPDFSYEHIGECIVDKRLWSNGDPRKTTVATTYKCSRCGDIQSDIPEQNYCKCFPNLYGTQRGPCPVQIYRTADGRNNGLIACLVSFSSLPVVLQHSVDIFSFITHARSSMPSLLLCSSNFIAF